MPHSIYTWLLSYPLFISNHSLGRAFLLVDSSPYTYSSDISHLKRIQHVLWRGKRIYRVRHRKYLIYQNGISPNINVLCSIHYLLWNSYKVPTWLDLSQGIKYISSYIVYLRIYNSLYLKYLMDAEWLRCVSEYAKLTGVRLRKLNF